MAKLGLSMGLQSKRFCKRQHRWMFTVDGILGDFSSNLESFVLPPEKSARPSVSFKESVAHHLVEDIYYPTRPDWKPINVTVYDLKKNNHPIFEWIKLLYDPKNGKFLPPNTKSITNSANSKSFIKTCTLEMYDGCGDTVERWIYEDCWLQNADFQTLDYSQDGIMMCDLTIRYARAYIDDTKNGLSSQGS